MRQVLGALSVAVPIGLIAVDPEGLSWYHNRRWEDITGHRRQDMLDAPWFEAVHPDDVAALRRAWTDRFNSQGRLGTFRVVDPAGAVHTCRAEVVAMKDSDWELFGYLIVAVDADSPEGFPALTSAHLLDALLDRSADIVTILNPDGTWRWSSGSTLRLFGHRAEYDPQSGILPFIHPDDRERAVSALAKVLAGEASPDERFEMRVLVADGSSRDMEGLVDVLIADPAVQGVVIHARDITDRKLAQAQLEESNRRLLNVIDNMRAAVVLEDEQNRVVMANQAFVDLYRLPYLPAELQGRTLDELGFRLDLIVDPPNVKSAAPEVRATIPKVEGARLTMVDGRVFEVDFIPMHAGESYRGSLSVVRDITDRTRVERERERLLASERAENRRLAELDAYKSEFLAIVSHELRTPLTSIVGYTQLLRHLVEERGAPEEADYLDAISRNVDRLLRLAGDLVVLDSIESGTLPLRVSPVDVGAIVQDVVRTMGPSAAASDISIGVDVQPGPPLPADADRVEQLLENLVSNAVKFTPDGGQVTVRAAPANGDGWVIEVRDNGIGVPEDELGLLYERFFRGSNALRRGLPGTGLGLAVARAIVDLHHGAIDVRSQVGTGTEFSVRLQGVEPQEGAETEGYQLGSRRG